MALEYFGPIIGAMIFTASLTAIAIGVYEILQHQDFHFFISTPLGQAVTYTLGGSVLIFILFNDIHKDANFYDAFRYHLKNQGHSRYFVAGIAGMLSLLAVVYNYTFVV